MCGGHHPPSYRCGLAMHQALGCGCSAGLAQHKHAVGGAWQSPSDISPHACIHCRRAGSLPISRLEGWPKAVKPGLVKVRSPSPSNSSMSSAHVTNTCCQRHVNCDYKGTQANSTPEHAHKPTRMRANGSRRRPRSLRRWPTTAYPGCHARWKVQVHGQLGLQHLIQWLACMQEKANSARRLWYCRQ